MNLRGLLILVINLLHHVQADWVVPPRWNDSIGVHPEMNEVYTNGQDIGLVFDWEGYSRAPHSVWLMGRKITENSLQLDWQKIMTIYSSKTRDQRISRHNWTINLTTKDWSPSGVYSLWMVNDEHPVWHLSSIAINLTSSDADEPSEPEHPHTHFILPTWGIAAFSLAGTTLFGFLAYIFRTSLLKFICWALGLQKNPEQGPLRQRRHGQTSKSTQVSVPVPAHQMQDTLGHVEMEMDMEHDDISTEV
ncbi:hypothetical protein N0V90_008582 [Kalmusia sp. IMI 367209]|nr:hypothetical protein N0V90_008582 [Kalmusia sp. IMI 367209]